MRFLITLLPALITFLKPAYGQETNGQLWFEYMINYPFANAYLFENAFTYSTLLKSSRWKSFDYSPTVEYAWTQHVDLMVGGTLAYTAQNDNYNTLEVRPAFGARIHFTPNKRIIVRLLARVEQRNFKNRETDEWERNIRPRFRLESLIPLSKDSYFEDNLWYGVADFEWLLTAGDDVEERFANRLRGRVGLGYRLNYTSRFEFLYMFQKSRNKVGEDFESSDNIIRLRYKHYLRKSKPTQRTGIGN